MAALRSCFFSPAFSATSSSTKPLFSTPATILPSGGRREHRLPRLKTAAPRPRLAVQARNRDGHAQPLGRRPTAGDYFHEEMERISQHYHDIITNDDGFLYVTANSMPAWVCLSANEALAMASRVMDSAGLNLGAPSEISVETAHLIVRPYAAVFSGAADDSYNRTVNKTTVDSFLFALRGLAAVSHNLLEGALEAVAHRSARDGVSEYAFNSDVEGMYHEFKQRMSELEGKIQSAAKPIETCRLVGPTIRTDTQAAGSFVRLMVARRTRALEKAHSKSLV